MRKIADILLVSVVAVLVAAPAHAEIVSTTRLDTRLGTGGNLGTLATKSAVVSADITDGTIVNADISASAAIAKSKLASDVQTSLGKADTALQAHQDISGKQDKSTAVTHTANTAVGDSTHPVYVASNGVATQIAKVAAASAADTATTATNAKKICNGSTCASYVDVWVE